MRTSARDDVVAAHGQPMVPGSGRLLRPRHVRRRHVRRAAAAEQVEPDLDLFAQQLQHLRRTLLTRGGETPERRPAHEHRPCAERERDEDVRPAPDATVDEHLQRRSPAASTISGRTSSVAGARSSCRPPWFETTTPAAPCSAASTASSAGRRRPSRPRAPGTAVHEMLHVAPVECRIDHGQPSRRRSLARVPGRPPARRPRASTSRPALAVARARAPGGRP